MCGWEWPSGVGFWIKRVSNVSGEGVSAGIADDISSVHGSVIIFCQERTVG